MSAPYYDSSSQYQTNNSYAATGGGAPPASGPIYNAPGPQTTYHQGTPLMGSPMYPVQPVLYGGMCPHQIIHESFTCCGITTAVLCFPCGLICCLGKPEKRCQQCGALLDTGC
eukprot:ANDGO_00883.mRNA.1 hypothetical protein AMSG_11939